MFYRDVRAGGVPGCGVTESGRVLGAGCLTLSGAAGAVGAAWRSPLVAALSVLIVAESTGTAPVT